MFFVLVKSLIMHVICNLELFPLIVWYHSNFGAHLIIYIMQQCWTLICWIFHMVFNRFVLQCFCTNLLTFQVLNQNHWMEINVRLLSFWTRIMACIALIQLYRVTWGYCFSLPLLNEWKTCLRLNTPLHNFCLCLRLLPVLMNAKFF